MRLGGVKRSARRKGEAEWENKRHVALVDVNWAAPKWPARTKNTPSLPCKSKTRLKKAAYYQRRYATLLSTLRPNGVRTKNFLTVRDGVILAGLLRQRRNGYPLCLHTFNRGFGQE